MNEKKPPGFMFYFERFGIMQKLSDEQLSRVMRAVFGYFENGDIPELGQVEDICFTLLKTDIDNSFDKYNKTCARNKENRNKSKTSEVFDYEGALELLRGMDEP